MNKYLDRIESIKYRLLILGNQLQLGIISEEEHDKLVMQLEHEIRLLEEKIFNNKLD